MTKVGDSTHTTMGCRRADASSRTCRDYVLLYRAVVSYLHCLALSEMDTQKCSVLQHSSHMRSRVRSPLSDGRQGRLSRMEWSECLFYLFSKVLYAAGDGLVSRRNERSTEGEKFSR